MRPSVTSLPIETPLQDGLEGSSNHGGLGGRGEPTSLDCISNLLKLSEDEISSLTRAGVMSQEDLAILAPDNI